MLASQDGKCAICGTTDTGKHMNFCIDHDHATGKIRSLLCNFCNAGLGHFRDNPQLLRKGADYIIKHREGPALPSPIDIL